MPNDHFDAMTDRWTDRLSEYVDGELDAPTRQALETHLATCASCRATRDALERVVARARRVGYHEPAQDLWTAIERTIGQESPRRRRPRLVTVSLSRLMVAAALVAVVAGGFAWTIASRRVASSAVAVVRDTVTPPLAALGSGSALAVASYRDAAADLERAFQAGRGTLRPETTRVIEENLRAIDIAIAQADSALRRDPGSAYLNQYLATTMQRKLKLLRRAVEITTARS
ncbi:MAG TPA: zf-HC2 domain-containing protein, partial [Gemmatimonadaceae bacterium]|nr:zf-HC2 domain-containing protein [Gemmatimonadaceae bacterium]